MGFLTNMRRSLSRQRLKARVSRFGNNHSARLNNHYVDYHRRAMAAFDGHCQAGSEQVTREANTLREQGFLTLPSQLSDDDRAALKARVDEAFARTELTYPFGSGGVRLVDGYEQFPDVVDLLLGRWEQVLIDYYRAHFKLYAVTIYRIIPDESAPESSFLWHFDNAPDLQLKVMIYLDETAEDSGAFRFKSIAESERVRQLGFWHRDDYNLAQAVLDDESSTHVVEGPPGTGIVFRPGRVVHKATAPRRDHRDVAVLVINPSLVYWREHLARNRQYVSTNAGLCLDLDTDQPENIGYRF